MIELKKKFDILPLIIKIELLKVKNRDNLTISEIAKEIKIHNSDKNFYKVKEELMENKIISISDKIGSAKIVTINHKKLRKLIERDLFINYIIKYILFPTGNILMWNIPKEI